MMLPARALRAAGCLAGGALLACVAGCPTPPPAGASDDPPFLDTVGNFDFDLATALPIAQNNDELRFRGSIESGTDVDIFDLGEIAVGDLVFVDVQAAGGDLDAVAALFDSREFLHAYNDDRTPDASNLNPQIDFVIRGATGKFFLGIAALPESGTSGDYEVFVSIVRGFGGADPVTQTVFLDWDGGQNVDVQNVGEFDLSPFDAGDFGDELSPFTPQIKARIQQLTKEAYGGVNLIVLNSDDHAEPTEPHSTIYFGGNSRRAFAISQQIDTGNEDRGDDAIVFTRAYEMAFSVNPSVEEISNAVGNTVAHEIGHLLGLVHTRSCNDLMDSTCTNDRLLERQVFGEAPLDPLVFPIGQQNSAELVQWLLGTAGL